VIVSLNAALARCEYPGRFVGGGAWELFEPLLFSSFAALVADVGAPGRAATQKLGGFASYRADPPLAAALVRRPEFAETADPERLANAKRDSRPLVYRYAAAGAAEGLAAPGADIGAQARAWRQLARMAHSDWLRAARIELAGEAEGAADPAAVASELHDEDIVERAAEHFDRQGQTDAAEALGRYLDARREGAWTPLGEAAGLAGLVARAKAEWRHAEADAALAAAQAAHEPPPPEKPKGFLAAMKGLFGG
jgi:hypothetical protein